MMIALEGIAGSGKTTLRDRILYLARDRRLPIHHIGQFSWLSPAATRTLVALRTGRASVDEPAAVTAVLDDLALHARHNIAAALHDGHVLADRLMLSSACLLGLVYPGTAESHLEALVRVTGAVPDLTVLVTTPVDLCAARLAARPTARRVGDDPRTATRLRELYHQCADAWPRSGGTPLRRRPLNTPEDTERLALELLDEMESAGTQ